MRIVEKRPSMSKNGGWLVTASPRHEWARFVHTLDATNCHQLSNGRYWLSDQALETLNRHIADQARQQDTREQQHAAPPPPQREVLSCFGALYLRDNAPWEVVQAAYRALSKLAHPDMPGGSKERMQVLNTAYAACKVARGQQ